MGKINVENIQNLLVKSVVYVKSITSCDNCPFYVDDLPWCNWLKRRLEPGKRHEACRVKKVTVEEI